MASGIWLVFSSLTATLFILLYSWAFNKLEELDLIFGTQIVWLVITILFPCSYQAQVISLFGHTFSVYLVPYYIFSGM